MMIECRYSCTECGIERRAVFVPERTIESVTDWTMSVLAVAISRDHRAVSPLCPATHIAEILVPIAGAYKIGGPALN